MSNTTTFVERGEFHWAKVLGDPVKDFDGTNREWTFDFVPIDPKALGAKLKKLGVGDRLRVKEGHLDDRPYMTLKQKEVRNDGGINKPPMVVDAAGQPWNQQNLIGNGSVGDVKFDVVDFGPKKYNGVYPRALRVLKHVAYAPQAFDSLDEDDEFYDAVADVISDAPPFDTAPTSGADAVIAAAEGKYDDLDDDLPM